jgi:hypothetical protein
MFFNYDPAGCISHGSVTRDPILQPPSRMFVVHPTTGAENHLQVRKAGACKHCWMLPGRHQDSCIYTGYCKMCLERYIDMPQEGRRHACGQGHLSKPREKREANPGVVPQEAPEPSPLAARLKLRQQENIAAAKAKRKREEEPPADPPAAAQTDPTPAQAAADPPAKEPAPADPPGEDSPAPAEAEAATPASKTAAKPLSRMQRVARKV